MYSYHIAQMNQFESLMKNKQFTKTKKKLAVLTTAYSAPGFSLIELMVTVAIVGILAAVAYPSYTQYIVRSNRSAAQSYMLGLASQQAQFLLDARSYFCTTGACSQVLNASTTPAFIPPAEVSKNYNVQVTSTNVGLPTFTITATPIGAQLSRDTKCKILTLDHIGTKGISGGTSTATQCWS